MGSAELRLTDWRLDQRSAARGAAASSSQQYLATSVFTQAMPIDKAFSTASARVRSPARRRAAIGESRPDIDAYELLHGIGNLYAGVDGDARYDARRMVGCSSPGYVKRARPANARPPPIGPR